MIFNEIYLILLSTVSSQVSITIFMIYKIYSYLSAAKLLLIYHQCQTNQALVTCDNSLLDACRQDKMR